MENTRPEKIKQAGRQTETIRLNEVATWSYFRVCLVRQMAGSLPDAQVLTDLERVLQLLHAVLQVELNRPIARALHVDL